MKGDIVINPIVALILVAILAAIIFFIVSFLSAPDQLNTIDAFAKKMVCEKAGWLAKFWC